MYKSEDRILLERDKMLEEVKSLRKETQHVRDDLVAEKQRQKVVIEKLNRENLNSLVKPFALTISSHDLRFKVCWGMIMNFYEKQTKPETPN